MFKCYDCGYVFEEPKHYSEDRTPGGAFEGGSFIEHFTGCPQCAGAYDEAVECDGCGEWCFSKYLKLLVMVIIVKHVWKKWRWMKMKYNVGDEFILHTSLGDKVTKIVNIKYEFADYIKGGPKYVSEQELEGYTLSGVLKEFTEDKKFSDKELLEVVQYLANSDRFVGLSVSDILREVGGSDELD